MGYCLKMISKSSYIHMCTSYTAHLV